MNVSYFESGRTSGVTDHYALDDEHALVLARRVVANLNRTKNIQVKEKKNGYNLPSTNSPSCVRIW
jgi:acetyl-CoA carboxylase carboxyltransferase component